MKPRILFPKPLLISLHDERVRKLPNETGGFLLGRRHDQDIDVTRATFEAEGDIATPTSFERASGDHARVTVSAWTQDGMLTGLVGDWHSHPFGAVRPSQTDLIGWRHLRTATNGGVMGLILSDNEQGLYWIQYGWNGLKIRTCRQIEEDSETLVFEA